MKRRVCNMRRSSCSKPLILAVILTCIFSGGCLKKFPEGFLWGVSTAGFQSEGGDTASIWAEWDRQERVRDRIGKSVDFLHRYREDVDLAAGMGSNTFRISIEWDRVEPEKGVIDQGALAYYDDLIDAITEKGMQPVVTLIHFNYPKWLEDECGWESPLAVDYYLRYADLVVSRYGDRVKYWITFNEPNIWPIFGWTIGVMPPGKVDIFGASKVKENIVAAHRKAYDLIHLRDPDSLVSANMYLIKFRHWLIGFILNSDYIQKEFVLDDIDDKLDYLSIDYYYNFTSFYGLLSANGKKWLCTIDPEGMYETLKKYSLEYPDLPIMIAENGIATENGKPRGDGWTRSEHLKSHVYWMQKAMSEGVNVIGYLYWSLTDNFEWGGYDERFGLYTVNALSDPELARIPTDAVQTYSDIIAGRGVPDGYTPGK
jgi:beta-glucosidase